MTHPRRLNLLLSLALATVAACAPTTAAPTLSPATVAPTLAPTSTEAGPAATPGVYPTVVAGEPIPCNGHDLVYAPPLHMVLLANCALESEAFVPAPMRLWGWDGTVWRLVDDTGPSVRGLAGVAYDTQRNQLVMAGGRSMAADFTDMWAWDGQTWTELAGTPGTVSNHFSMVYDPGRDQIVMYGGQNLQEVVQNGTWEWDPTQAAWEKVSPSGPSLHVHYALAYDAAHARVLLFGEGPNELWAWTGGPKWERLTNAAGAQAGPSVRAGARMAFDAATNQVVLFGGYVYGANGHALSDTWLWDGDRWTEYTGPGPAERSHHSMAYDAERQVIVLYGGYGGGDIIRDDTWEWDGAAWHCVARCES